MLDTALDIVDIDVKDGRVCITRGDAFTCLAAAGPNRDEGDVAPIERPSLPDVPPLASQPPPVSFTSAPVVAAAIGGTVGVAALAAAPLLLSGNRENVPEAFAVAGLMSLGGAGVSVGIASAVFGVGLLVVAASAPRHVASDGSCIGDLASLFGDALSACISVVAAAVGVVLLATAVGLVAGGVIAVAVTPTVDRALGPHLFESNAYVPFWPALIGATAGGAGGVVASLFLLNRDEDELSEDQRSLDNTASGAASVALILGGAALVGSLGYAIGSCCNTP